MRWLLLPVFSICLCTLASEPALAQSNLCSQLEAQLAAASSGGQSKQYKKYDRAVKTQRQQLKKARRNARRAGCKTGAFSLLRNSGNNRQCRSLVSTIDKMERNLSQLERRRTRYETGDSRIKRATLLARIAANGCRDKAVVARREEQLQRRSERINILDQIFNSRSKRRGPLDDEYGNRITTTLNGSSAGSLEQLGAYRTMCVRTCDGYYFPISITTSETLFDRDQKVCEANCPGTEVKLYYHRVPGEESEDMVSLAGEPYSELSTAFLYRQAGYRRDKSCGCSPVKDFSIIAGELKEQEAMSEAFIPMPTPRPDPASDPETLANRSGGLTSETIARILTAPPNDETPPTRTKNKVRVVGPVFLPDPEGAIDLQAQDRNSVQ